MVFVFHSLQLGMTSLALNDDLRTDLWVLVWLNPLVHLGTLRTLQIGKFTILCFVLLKQSILDLRPTIIGTVCIRLRTLLIVTSLLLKHIVTITIHTLMLALGAAKQMTFAFRIAIKLKPAPDGTRQIYDCHVLIFDKVLPQLPILHLNLPPSSIRLLPVHILIIQYLLQHYRQFFRREHLLTHWAVVAVRVLLLGPVAPLVDAEVAEDGIFAHWALSRVVD